MSDGQVVQRIGADFFVSFSAGTAEAEFIAFASSMQEKIGNFGKQISDLGMQIQSVFNIDQSKISGLSSGIQAAGQNAAASAAQEAAYNARLVELETMLTAVNAKLAAFEQTRSAASKGGSYEKFKRELMDVHGWLGSLADSSGKLNEKLNIEGTVNRTIGSLSGLQRLLFSLFKNDAVNFDGLIDQLRKISELKAQSSSTITVMPEAEAKATEVILINVQKTTEAKKAQVSVQAEEVKLARESAKLYEKVQNTINTMRASSRMYGSDPVLGDSFREQLEAFERLKSGGTGSSAGDVAALKEIIIALKQIKADKAALIEQDKLGAAATKERQEAELKIATAASDNVAQGQAQKKTAEELLAIENARLDAAEKLKAAMAGLGGNVAGALGGGTPLVSSSTLDNLRQLLGMFDILSQSISNLEAKFAMLRMQGEVFDIPRSKTLLGELSAIEKEVNNIISSIAKLGSFSTVKSDPFVVATKSLRDEVSALENLKSEYIACELAIKNFKAVTDEEKASLAALQKEFDNLTTKMAASDAKIMDILSRAKSLIATSRETIKANASTEFFKEQSAQYEKLKATLASMGDVSKLKGTDSYLQMGAAVKTLNEMLNILKKTFVDAASSGKLSADQILNANKEYHALSKTLAMVKAELSSVERGMAEAARGTNRWEGTGFVNMLKSQAAWLTGGGLFFGVISGLRDAIKSSQDFEYQLKRAERTILLYGETLYKTESQVMAAYNQAMREQMLVTGQSAEVVGEALYQLGSAGLNASEVLAALPIVLKQIVGVEGDARETVKTIAGVFNSLKSAGALSSMGADLNSQFNKISDIMVKAFKDYQIEMDELQDGLKHTIAVSNAAGVSFQNQVAILATLNQHMIKGGLAGRGFRSMLMQIVQDIPGFVASMNKYGKVIEIDPKKPLDIMGILRQLNESMWNNTLSAERLNIIFTEMGLRGSGALVTLIQSFKEVDEAVRRFNNEGIGETVSMFDKLRDSMKLDFAASAGVMDGALRSLIGVPLLLAQQISKLVNAATGLFHLLPEWIQLLARWGGGFTALAWIIGSVVTIFGIAAGSGGKIATFFALFSGKGAFSFIGALKALTGFATSALGIVSLVVAGLLVGKTVYDSIKQSKLNEEVNAQKEYDSLKKLSDAYSDADLKMNKDTGFVDAATRRSEALKRLKEAGASAAEMDLYNSMSNEQLAKSISTGNAQLQKKVELLKQSIAETEKANLSEEFNPASWFKGAIGTLTGNTWSTFGDLLPSVLKAAKIKDQIIREVKDSNSRKLTEDEIRVFMTAFSAYGEGGGATYDKLVAAEGTKIISVLEDMRKSLVDKIQKENPGRLTKAELAYLNVGGSADIGVFFDMMKSTVSPSEVKKASDANIVNFTKTLEAIAKEDVPARRKVFMAIWEKMKLSEKAALELKIKEFQKRNEKAGDTDPDTLTQLLKDGSLDIIITEMNKYTGLTDQLSQHLRDAQQKDYTYYSALAKKQAELYKENYKERLEIMKRTQQNEIDFLEQKKTNADADLALGKISQAKYIDIVREAGEEKYRIQRDYLMNELEETRQMNQAAVFVAGSNTSEGVRLKREGKIQEKKILEEIINLNKTHLVDLRKMQVDYAGKTNAIQVDVHNKELERIKEKIAMYDKLRQAKEITPEEARQNLLNDTTSFGNTNAVSVDSTKDDLNSYFAKLGVFVDKIATDFADGVKNGSTTALRDLSDGVKAISGALSKSGLTLDTVLAERGGEYLKYAVSMAKVAMLTDAGSLEEANKVLSEAKTLVSSITSAEAALRGSGGTNSLYMYSNDGQRLTTLKQESDELNRRIDEASAKINKANLDMYSGSRISLQGAIAVGDIFTKSLREVGVEIETLNNKIAEIDMAKLTFDWTKDRADIARKGGEVIFSLKSNFTYFNTEVLNSISGLRDAQFNAIQDSFNLFQSKWKSKPLEMPVSFSYGSNSKLSGGSIELKIPNIEALSKSSMTIDKTQWDKMDAFYTRVAEQVQVLVLQGSVLPDNLRTIVDRALNK